MPQETGVTLVIEGRNFVQESPSFEQELYIMEQATEAGLTDLQGGLQLDPTTKNLPLIAQQMLVKAYKSGALFRLMAALLVEQGEEWTPEQAALNAEFFRKVRDPASKRHLQTGLVGAVLAFFESAANSDLTSLISSEAEQSGRPTPANGARKGPRPPMLTPEQAAAVFASGNMPPPSVKSRSITGSIPASSSGGKSAKGFSRTKRSSKSR